MIADSFNFRDGASYQRYLHELAHGKKITDMVSDKGLMRHFVKKNPIRKKALVAWAVLPLAFLIPMRAQNWILDRLAAKERMEWEADND